MLGFSHATSGALGWLVAAPAISTALAQASIVPAPLSPQEIAIGAVACAGAALMPDLDHPQATIAYTFGPVSHGVSKFTALVAGGHRQGTHSLLFSAGFGLVCLIAGMSSDWLQNPAFGMIMLFLLAAFAFRGMGIVPPRVGGGFKSIVIILEAAAFTYVVYNFMPTTWWWLGLAGFMGSVIHLIGDSLTPEGVPWFYPARWRFAIPIISHTGNFLERFVIGPLMVVGIGWMIWVIYSPYL